MSSVDDRIVNMKFENRQFTQGVTQSQKSLDGLEQSLQKTAKSKGLANLDQQVGGLRQKFSAMQVAGVAAVATIASKATMLGLSLARSFTIDPMRQGFQEYQTNLNSIQTIIANTGKKLPIVQGALNDLNRYSDLTIYNFSQMASAIGKFTAAGVALKPATASIKGMANVAALTGASADDLNRAMYQTSQALSAGTIRLMDWRSLENANMGTKNMREALMETAQSMGEEGKAMDAAIAKHGNFRDSLREGWLTADVFNKTMKVMAGRYDEATGKTVAYSAEQLKSMGYTDAQAKKINRLSQAAIDSATVIKTLPQMMDVVKESIGSLWSTAFSGIVGDFTKSKHLWTVTGNAITSQISKINFWLSGKDGRSGILGDWRDSGGRLAVIWGFRKVFKGLADVLGVVHQAFKDVFPPATGSGLANISKAWLAFAKMLRPSADTLQDLRKIFGGVFAVFHIGFTVVKALFSAFSGLFSTITGATGKAGGSVLGFAAHIGELVMKFDKMVTSGNVMVDFFHKIGEAIGGVVSRLGGAGGKVMDRLVASFNTGKLGAIVDKMSGVGQNIIDGITKGLEQGGTEKLKGILAKIANYIPDTIKNILGIHSPATTMIPIGENIIQGIVQGMDQAARFIFASIGKIFSAIIGGIRDQFGNMDALDFASVLNALFTGGMLLAVRNVANSFGNIGKSISGTFNNLGDALKSLQTKANAELIRSIAISVVALTGSLIALSMVPKEKLATSIGTIGALMTMLTAMMKVLGGVGEEVKISKKGMEGGSLQLIVMAKAIKTIAAAMLILSAAVVLLGRQDMDTLKKGLGAVAIIMGLVIGSFFALAKMGPLTKGAAGSMLVMAIAMNVLVGAVAAFGNMKMETLKKGFGAVAIGLGLFVGALIILSKNIGSTVVAAGAMLTMAGAMVVLTAAVATFGHMDMKTLKRGFGAVAIGIGIFVAALILLGQNIGGTIVAAGAMLTMALALGMIVPVIATLGGMDMDKLKQGLGAVAVALLAMVVAAAALGAVGEAFGPGLLMLGGAIALIGLGMAAFGAGFALMAAAGTAGIAVMTAAITAFIMLLPSIAIQMAAALVTFLETIAAAAPRVRAAMGTIFAQLLGVITDAIPQIGLLISALVKMLLDVLERAIPEVADVARAYITAMVGVLKHSAKEWFDAAIYVVDHILTGLDNHASEFIDKGTDIIVNVIEGFGRAGARIANAIGDTLFKFLTALDAEIVYYAPKIAAEGKLIAKHLVEGFATGLVGQDNVNKIKGAVHVLVGIAKAGFTGPLGFIINSPSKLTRRYGQYVGEGLALGMDDSKDQVGRSARGLTKHASKNMVAGISDSIGIAVRNAVKMANAVLAAGDPQAESAYAQASAAQKVADAAQARADLAKQNAARFKGKAAKSKAAKAAQKAADRAQRAADAAQAQADAANQSASDLKDFNAADLHTKGDKRNEAAASLAEQAQKRLELANAKMARSIEIGKKNRKAAAALRAAAIADAQQAAVLAQQAQEAHAQAVSYYGDEVMQRLNAIADARAAEKKAAEDQAAYDAADTQGKIDILNKRMAEQQAIADKRNADAAALLEKARGEAYNNAAQAMADLDASEQAAQDAKDAADAAQQAKDQLEQLTSNNGGLSGGSSGGGTTIQPSRSVLEDAAKAMDRYTESLMAAQEAMNAAPTVIQYEQNNYSPEALSASEIYRQTHNLLSTKSL